MTNDTGQDPTSTLTSAFAVDQKGGLDVLAPKPCPFCGKEPILIKMVEDDDFDRWHKVMCEECGIEMGEEYRSDAIAAWNRRAALPQESATEPVAWRGLSPLPWTYHNQPNFGTMGKDWIEDAHGNIVVENVGHIDGPFICQAVARLAVPIASPLVGDEAASEMRKTAQELRDNANGDCTAIQQAIFWESKAAALSAASIPTGVKTLAWETFEGRSYVQANCVLGQYQVSYLREFETWQMHRPAVAGTEWKENFSRHATRDEAKAAAQSDYERRILSALISPSPVGGQDLPVAGEISRDGVEYLLDDKGFPLDVGGGDVLAVVENIPDDPTLAYTAGWNDCRRAALSHPAPERAVEALRKLRSYNVDIRDGRINYRPDDHIKVIDAALSAKEGQNND